MVLPRAGGRVGRRRLTNDRGSSSHHDRAALSSFTIAPSHLTAVRPTSWLLELLWLAVAAVITIVLCLPPHVQVGPYYEALELATCAFLFVTLSRLVFFSDRAPWMAPQFMKGVVPILCVPVILFAALTLNTVQTTVDAEGLDGIFISARGEDAISWGTYLRDIAVLVCSGTIIAAVVLPVVLLVRLWRQVKGDLRTRS